MDGIAVPPVTNFFFFFLALPICRYDYVTIDYGLSLGVLSLSLRLLGSQAPSLCFPSFYLLD